MTEMKIPTEIFCIRPGFPPEGPQNMDYCGKVVNFMFLRSDDPKSYEFVDQHRGKPLLVVLETVNFNEDLEWLRFTKQRSPKIKTIVSLSYPFGDHSSLGNAYIEEVCRSMPSSASGRNFARLPNYEEMIFKHIEKCIDIGADGFISLREIDSPTNAAEFIRYLLNDNRHRLYLFVAPSGSGKTTIIEDLRCLGLRRIPKVTTRLPRSPDEILKRQIHCVSRKKFEALVAEGAIFGSRYYHGNYYGYFSSDLSRQITEHSVMCDFSELEVALRLRTALPNLAYLVTIFPSIEHSYLGLKRRLEDLTEPSEILASREDEIKFLLRRKKALQQDTRERLTEALDYSKEFRHNLGYFDIVLDSDNRIENIRMFFAKANELD